MSAVKAGLPKIAAVFREPEFSNQALEADRAILTAAAEHLRDRFDVTFSEARAFQAPDDLRGVLTMAESGPVLTALSALEAQGVCVFNSSRAVRSCFRSALYTALSTMGFPVPPTVRCEVGSETSIAHAFSSITSWSNGFWIKRADFHALSDSDVVFQKNSSGLHEVLEGFSQRGISSVVLQRHISGRVLKFYRVADRFFDTRWLEGSFRGETEFSGDVVFARDRVESLSRSIGEALGLKVFGGDLVIESSGKYWVIDVNDWPSFRTCREQAAEAIAHEFSDALRQRARILAAETVV